jgi:hypothetical protein
MCTLFTAFYDSCAHTQRVSTAQIPKGGVALECIRCSVTGATDYFAQDGQATTLAAGGSTTEQPSVDQSSSLANNTSDQSTPSSNVTIQTAVDSQPTTDTSLLIPSPDFDYSTLIKCDNGTKALEYVPGKQAVCQLDKTPCPRGYLCETNKAGYGSCCPVQPDVWKSASASECIIPSPRHLFFRLFKSVLLIQLEIAIRVSRPANEGTAGHVHIERPGVRTVVLQRSKVCVREYGTKCGSSKSKQVFATKKKFFRTSRRTKATYAPCSHPSTTRVRRANESLTTQNRK